MPELQLTAQSIAEEDNDGSDFATEATSGFVRFITHTLAGSVRHAAIRFTNVTIPQGTVVSVASFQIWIPTTGDDPRADIYLEDIGDSLSFVANADVTSRARTTATGLWNQTNLGINNGFKTCPVSLVDQVNEVLAREDWVSGNSMTILLRGRQDASNRICYISQDSGERAIFTITYPDPVVPEITDVQPRTFSDGELVNITGTGFKASQGNGKVELGDHHQYNLANKVQQNIDHWEDLLVKFITNKGSLPNGRVFVFLTNDDGETNDPPPPEDPGDLGTELEDEVTFGSVGSGGGQSTEIRLERIYASVSNHTTPRMARDRHFLMQRIGQELGINITSGTRSFETNLALLYRELTGSSWTGAKSVEMILGAIEENL